ncbi:hypothetical protein ACFL2Q_05315 [Thermodesulfobacteriota bacterium]
MTATLIGIGIWVLIFVVWYIKTYPEMFGGGKWIPSMKFKWPRWPSRKKPVRPVAVPKSGPLRKGNYKHLVEIVESVSAKDRFSSSDAASMVEAVRELMLIEPASGQVWEAFALDALETAHIECDDCRIPVEKTVKKTGVKIHCEGCHKWLALKNSKVTVIDPTRADLEDWER